MSIKIIISILRFEFSIRIQLFYYRQFYISILFLSDCSRRVYIYAYKLNNKFITFNILIQFLIEIWSQLPFQLLSINEISDENWNKFLSQQNLRKLNNISIRHSPFQSGPSSFLLGSKAAVDYARDYALIRSETPLSTCSSYQRHAVQLARCRVSPLRSSEIQLISLHPLHLQKIILDRTPKTPSPLNEDYHPKNSRAKIQSWMRIL